MSVSLYSERVKRAAFTMAPKQTHHVERAGARLNSVHAFPGLRRNVKRAKRQVEISAATTKNLFARLHYTVGHPSCLQTCWFTPLFLHQVWGLSCSPQAVWPARQFFALTGWRHWCGPCLSLSLSLSLSLFLLLLTHRCFSYLIQMEAFIWNIGTCKAEKSRGGRLL